MEYLHRYSFFNLLQNEILQDSYSAAFYSWFGND
jgi:hypothetical protein